MINIFRHTEYGARSYGPQFEQVLSVRWTQANGEFAVFSFETLRPTAGLLSGPRFATLVIDGQTIATGEIIGYPISLAGDVITVEIACRHPEFSGKVDAVFAAIPVSERLIDRETPRRSERYVTSDIYQHPLEADPKLVPIAGIPRSDFEFRGEGHSNPAHPIFRMSPSVIGAPISKLEITASSTHNESSSRVLNVGGMIGEHDTLTPDEYKSAIESLSITGSNVEQLSVSVQTRFTFNRPAADVTVRRPRIDPITFLQYGRKDVILTGEAFDAPDMPTVVSVERARREDLVLTLTAGVMTEYGGDRSDKEQIGLANVELDLLNETAHTRTGRPGSAGYIRRFRNIRASFWKDAGTAAQLAVRNLVDYGAAKILRAAHCVRLDIECTAASARMLTLQDRITVRDARLETGSAIGKVDSIEWTEGENGGDARVSVLVPVGTGGEYATPGSVMIRGNVGQDPDIVALENLNVGHFVEEMIYEGNIVEQRAVIDEINAKNRTMKPAGQTRYESEEIRAVRDYLPKPKFSLGFRQTGGKDPLDSKLTASWQIPIPKGI